MEIIGRIRFRRTDSIGLGKQHCEVFRGEYAQDAKYVRAVAIKRMQKKRTQVDSTFYCKTHVHPNIIQYFGTEDDEIEFMYLATEICAGTLQDFFTGKYEGPEVGDCRSMMNQISRGLNHLHLLEIVHGDLKPSNILISLPNGDLGPALKLADFGFSHAFRNKDGSQEFLPAYTEGWKCPLDPLVVNGKRDLPTDIFPLGILFGYIALRGVYPFGTDLDDAIGKMKNREPLVLKDIKTIDSYVKGDQGFFINLFTNMVSYEARPTVYGVLNHPFFTQQLPIMAPPRPEQQLEVTVPTVEPFFTVENVIRNGPALVCGEMSRNNGLNPSQELRREAMPHEQPANREKNDEPAATTCSLSSVSKEPEVITLDDDESDEAVAVPRHPLLNPLDREEDAHVSSVAARRSVSGVQATESTVITKVDNGETGGGFTTTSDEGNDKISPEKIQENAGEESFLPIPSFSDSVLAATIRNASTILNRNAPSVKIEEMSNNSLSHSWELRCETLPHKQPLKREKSDEPAASNYPFVSKEPEVIILDLDEDDARDETMGANSVPRKPLLDPTESTPSGEDFRTSSSTMDTEEALPGLSDTAKTSASTVIESTVITTEAAAAERVTDGIHPTSDEESAMEVDRHFYEASQVKESPQGQVHVPLPSHSTPCLTNGGALDHANPENGSYFVTAEAINNMSENVNRKGPAVKLEEMTTHHSLNHSQELRREAMPHEQPFKREKIDEPATSNYRPSFVSKEFEVITLDDAESDATVGAAAVPRHPLLNPLDREEDAHVSSDAVRRSERSVQTTESTVIKAADDGETSSGITTTSGEGWAIEADRCCEPPQDKESSFRLVQVPVPSLSTSDTEALADANEASERASLSCARSSFPIDESDRSVDTVAPPVTPSSEDYAEAPNRLSQQSNMTLMNQLQPQAELAGSNVKQSLLSSNSVPRLHKDGALENEELQKQISRPTPLPVPLSTTADAVSNVPENVNPISQNAGRQDKGKRLARVTGRVREGSPIQQPPNKKSRSNEAAASKRINPGSRLRRKKGVLRCDLAENDTETDDESSESPNIPFGVNENKEQFSQSFYEPTFKVSPPIKIHYTRGRARQTVDANIDMASPGPSNPPSAHTDAKRFKCYICDKEHPTKINMVLCIETHTPDTEFKCDQCSKVFSSRGELEKHKLRRRRYAVCKLCGDAFCNHNVLNKHLKNTCATK